MRYSKILFEELTQQQKMAMWIAGTRGFAYKLADTNKIIGNINILFDIFNKTHNVVALSKIKLLIDELFDRGIFTVATNFKNQLQNVKANAGIKSPAQKQPQQNVVPNWDALADKLYKDINYLSTVKGYNDALRKLLNIKAREAIDNSPAQWLDCANKSQLLIDIFRRYSGSFEPLNNKVKRMLEDSTTHSKICYAVLEIYLARLALINIILTVKSFFEQQGGTITNDVFLDAATIQMTMDLSAVCKKLLPANKKTLASIPAEFEQVRFVGFFPSIELTGI